MERGPGQYQHADTLPINRGGQTGPHSRAPCRFVWKAASSTRGRLRERAGRQVLELGHAQVGDSDEVAASPEAPCSTFGLFGGFSFHLQNEDIFTCDCDRFNIMGVDVEKKPQMTLEKRINLGDAIPLSTPLVVYIEPTTYCNLACKFCPHYLSYDDFEHGHMPTEIFHKACDEMLDFPEKVRLLRICGLGDSLFNKQIESFVEYAGRVRPAEKIELITNGLLLKEKHFLAFSNNLTRLIVSIEGLSNEDYLEFTNRKVDFDKFVETLKAFARIESRHCRLHVKIHNSAVSTPERLQRFHEIFSDIADELYVENLINLWPELVSNLGLNSGHRFVSKSISPQVACAQIFKSMQVNFDGKVMPCCIDWKVINVIGDIQKQTLQEIWTGSEMLKLQIRHLNGERNSFNPCAGCSMNEESDIDSFDDRLDAVKNRLFDKYQRIAVL